MFTGLFRLGSQATIFVISDLQWGSPHFDEETFEKCLDDYWSTKNSYFIVVGDLIDFARKTVQAEIRKSLAGHMDYVVQYDQIGRKIVEEFYNKYFKNTKIIGVLEGHHAFPFSDGTTSDQYFTQLAKTHFMGPSALIALSLDYHNSKQRVVMHIQHGCGTARYISTDLSQLERGTFPYYDGVDIFIRAHSAKFAVVPTVKYSLNQRVRLEQSTCYLIQNGGFRRSRLGQVSSDYVESSNLPPAPIGYTKIYLSLRREERVNKPKLRKLTVKVEQVTW